MNGLSKVNWQALYLSMSIGDEVYLVACSRKYAAEQLNTWRRRIVDDVRWFKIEPAFCRHDGMEGMIITRLSGPSIMQEAAQRARVTKALQREAVGV